MIKLDIIQIVDFWSFNMWQCD